MHSDGRYLTSFMPMTVHIDPEELNLFKRESIQNLTKEDGPPLHLIGSAVYED